MWLIVENSYLNLDENLIRPDERASLIVNKNKKNLNQVIFF